MKAIIHSLNYAEVTCPHCADKSSLSLVDLEWKKIQNGELRAIDESPCPACGKRYKVVIVIAGNVYSTR